MSRLWRGSTQSAAACQDAECTELGIQGQQGKSAFRSIREREIHTPDEARVLRGPLSTSCYRNRKQKLQILWQSAPCLLESTSKGRGLHPPNPFRP